MTLGVIRYHDHGVMNLYMSTCTSRPTEFSSVRGLEDILSDHCSGRYIIVICSDVKEIDMRRVNNDHIIPVHRA